MDLDQTRQAEPRSDASFSEARHVLWQHIKHSRFGMLTTFDRELGVLRSRPMTNQGTGDEFDGELWFITAEDGAVAREVSDEPEVNISYAKPDDNSFVSVSGRASLVEDRARIHALWSPLYKAWFPQGPDDPNIVLLRVKVSDAEYWDGPSNKVTQLFAMARSALGGKPASQMGEHARIHNA